MMTLEHIASSILLSGNSLSFVQWISLILCSIGLVVIYRNYKKKK